MVRFSREPDDDSDTPETFLLEVGGWVDMGNPDTITVTIEPGNLLNE